MPRPPHAHTPILPYATGVYDKDVADKVMMVRRNSVIGLLVLVLGVAAWVGFRRPEPTVTLAAVGDVLFARGVGEQVSKHGVDYPFDGTRAITSGADLAFCNLECTLSGRGFAHRRRFRFRADPACAGALARAGFDVVSLANNHTLDYGRTAMLDTADAVRRAGLAPSGAGTDRRDAIRLHVVERNGLRIGFLCYTDIENFVVVRLDDRPTTAGVNPDTIAAEIRSARRMCDVLVVSFHWGVEYMKRPTEHQVSLAHHCIDSGADLVLGHHPHVLQPVEVYKGKPIIYSMGGFVWDSRVSGADHSAIYLLELRRSSARLLRTIPVKVERCRPRVTEAGG